MKILTLCLLCLSWPAWAADVGTGPILSPTDLMVQGSPIKVQWTDASNNEVKFRIERRTDPFNNWVYIGCADWNSTEFTDPIHAPGKYCYRVNATNYGAESPYSPEKCMDFIPGPPPAPVLTLSTLPMVGTLQRFPVLFWQKQVQGVVIHIDRKAPNSSWNFLPESEASADMFHDHRVTDAVKYCYRARFFNENGDSPYSNTVCLF